MSIIFVVLNRYCILNMGQSSKFAACGKMAWPRSHQSVEAVQMKNWDPLVLGPALAMDSVPMPECFNRKFSSLNFSP